LLVSGCNLVEYAMKDRRYCWSIARSARRVVKRVSGLLYERGTTILYADQHIDRKLGNFSCAWSGPDGREPAESGFNLVGYRWAFTWPASGVRLSLKTVSDSSRRVVACRS
jgi:hypothetical protein